MRSPRFRRVAVAAAAAPIILLTACSGDGDSDSASQSGDDAAATSMGPQVDIADVEVTQEEQDGVSVPALTVDGEPVAEASPVSTSSTQVRSVEEGEGEGATTEDEVRISYALANGATGEELVSTFPTEAEVTIDLGSDRQLPAFLEELPGQKPGSSLVMAVPPEGGFGAQGNEQLGVGPQDTLLFYLEVNDVRPRLTQAEGTDVEPVDGLPTVEADGTSPAQITIPDDADPPDELVSQLLIEGEREQVQAGQSLTVQYTGVKFSDGEQFDSSLERGEPFTFQVGAGQVIPGWDEGLVGVPVGSRVLLVIPAEDAYGAEQESGGNGLAGEDLVFVIDVLSAS